MIDYDFIPGDGEYIFFLHGFGGSKDSFALVKNHIAGKCNMVFISFPGFGDSPPPERPYSVSDYMFELKDLIVKIAKGKKVNIVCHSFGARVAAKLCYVYPNLINKLMIIDGAGLKPRRGIKYRIKVRKYKKLKAKVQAGKLNKEVLDLYGSSDYRSLPSVMKATFVKVVNEDLKRYFKGIVCPTLILWGEKDKETPLFMARKLKKYIADSGLFIIKDAGHFSYIDNVDAFIGAVNVFFFNN